MKKLLERAPRQLLAIGLILLIGVGYSIYRAASAFSPQDPVPQYQRSASPAFAIPDTVSIVDPTKVNEPRLPDAAYEQIIPKAQSVSSSIASGRLSAATLQRAGMSPGLAEKSLSQLRYYTRQIPDIGLRSVTAGSDLTFDDISVDGASVLSVVTYGAASGGSNAAAVTMELTYQFIRKGDQWKLQSMTTEL